MFQTSGKTGNPKFAQLYAYLVSFAALIALVVMTITGIIGAFKIALPEYSLSKYEYQSMQRETSRTGTVNAEVATEGTKVVDSIEEMLVGDSMVAETNTAHAPVPRAKMPPMLSREDILDSQRHDGIKSLIEMVATWIVCIPILWLHFAWAGRLGAREAKYRNNEQRYPRKRPSRPRPPKSG